MGISVGSQGLSRVVDEVFADLKGRFVFNFLDDLVVYSSSPEEHVAHAREVLTRLERTGFTLNTDKAVLGASEINYLGHLISGRGIKILPERVAAIQDYPQPTNLKSLRRFIGTVGFYAPFIPDYSSIAATLHELKKKGVPFCWASRIRWRLKRLSAPCERRRFFRFPISMKPLYSLRTLAMWLFRRSFIKT